MKFALNHIKKSKGVTWTCTGDPEFELDSNDKKDRGTEVKLFVDDDSKEFLEEARIQGLLDKYCKFFTLPN